VRDDTQDWLLEPEDKPPLLGELVERIEEALEAAHASEAAAAAIGASATDAAARARDAMEQAAAAAEHARRSAELAEMASAAASRPRARPLERGPEEDPSMRSFSDRADRLVNRLRALQRIPLRGSGRTGTVA
jgi:hypothetical protein